MISVVEATAGGHEFAGETQIRATRQVPPNLNVALNLDVQLPAGLQPKSYRKRCRQCCSSPSFSRRNKPFSKR